MHRFRLILFIGLLPIFPLGAQPLTLTWDDNSWDETGFKIERATSADAPFTQIAIVGPNVTSYLDTTAAADTPYRYRVRAFNIAGDSPYSNIASMAAAIAAPPADAPPVPPGGTTSFSITATGTPSPTLRWQISTDSGATWGDLGETPPYSGVATSTLTISPLPAGLDGHLYRAIATNRFGTAISPSATLAIDTRPRLINLSIRALAGGGNATLIVGFVIAGASPKPLLVRGIGPTLAAFGLSGTLGDPVLSLYSGTRQLSANDNWASAPNAPQIAAACARLGAFPIPETSLDAIVLSSLDTGAGTAQLGDTQNSSGLAILELYDAEPLGASRLINVSARTHVGTGAAAPVLGFAIAGDRPKRLLIRAIGPTLQSFGVSGALADPQLSLLLPGASTPLRQNDNWGGGADLKIAFAATGAFPLGDTSRDAALLVSLDPGLYTAQASGTNNTTGIALIEVYEVP